MSNAPYIPPAAGMPRTMRSVRAGEREQGELGTAAREFESLMLNEMLKSMRKSVPKRVK